MATIPPDGRYRVETPEQIGLEYEIAGLGSRAMAAIVDTLLLVVVLALTFCGIVFGLGTVFGAFADRLFGQEGETAFLWALAIFSLLNFAVLWGYYVFFETVWHGQTPGKRWVGIRVMQEGGYPIGFSQAVIRNIVRIIDYLPFNYVIGATVMLVDSRSRRLGDFAAGTIVVREERGVALSSLHSHPSWLEAAARASGGTATSAEQIPNLHRLTTEDQTIIREYFSRRSSLSQEAASALSLQLAQTFAAKLEYNPSGDVPEQFLLRLLQQQEPSVRPETNTSF